MSFVAAFVGLFRPAPGAFLGRAAGGGGGGGGTPPPFTPALRFNDRRNSQYL